MLREHVNNNGRAKVGYPTADEADQAARSMGGSKRRPYRAYQCSACKLWHVGRKPVTKAQKAAARRNRRRLERGG